MAEKTMRISAAVVMSVDAKLTRQDEADIRAWASNEDQAFFRQLLAEHDCVVMGRGTYEAIRQNIAIEDDRLRVVLTAWPDKFKRDKVAGKLEFLSLEPGRFVKAMRERGRHKILVVGGPQMIMDFLALELLDSIYITLEPYLFGRGKSLVPDMPASNQALRLAYHERLNDQGTLLLRYDTIKQSGHSGRIL